VAVRGREVANWQALFSFLSQADLADEAWFIEAEGPRKSHTDLGEFDFHRLLEVPRAVDIDMGAPARLAELRSWDGRTAIIDHDGSCYLIVRRTYYPGWMYRVGDGPERPVLKVNGGLQGVSLTGTGTSHVTFRYHPTGLRPTAILSLGAAAAALTVLILGVVRNLARGGTRPAWLKLVR
jgi:hypothetical protein